VQRSANVISIGPICLQGLKRPVNDLSRGAFISKKDSLAALVEDIVYIIAITAIQAGQG